VTYGTHSHSNLNYHTVPCFDKVAKDCIDTSWLLPYHLTTFAIRRAEESIEYFIEQQILQVTIA